MNDDKKNIKKTFFLHSCNINDNGVKVEREKEKSLKIKKNQFYVANHKVILPISCHFLWPRKSNFSLFP